MCAGGSIINLHTPFRQTSFLIGSRRRKVVQRRSASARSLELATPRTKMLPVWRTRTILLGSIYPSQLRTRLPQARQQNWCKNFLTLKLSVKFTLRHPTLLIDATLQIFLTQVWFFPQKKRVQYLVLMASAPHCWRDGELVSRRLYSYVLHCESTLCKTPHFQ